MDSIIHRVRYNQQARIPLETDRLISAELNGKSITDTYNGDTGHFHLGYDAVAELKPTNRLAITHELDGETITATIILEAK